MTNSKDNNKVNTTPELVLDLAADLTPVRPIRLSAVCGLWLVLCAINFAGFLYFLGGSWEPWLERLQSFSFVEAFVLLVCFVLGGATLLASAVPGHPWFRRLLKLFVSSLFLWIGILSAQLFLEIRPTSEWDLSGGMPCSVGILSFSALPAFILFAQIKKLAPVRPLLSSLILAFVPFSAAVLAFQAHCPDISPSHILVWHYSPLLFLLALSATIGSRILRLQVSPIHGQNSNSI